MADAAVADLRAEHVLPEICSRSSTASPSTDPRPLAAVQQAVGLARRPAPSATETSAGSQTYAHADADPHPGRLVAAAGEGRVRTRSRQRPVHRASPASSPSTSRRPPGTARPARTRDRSFQYGWWGYVDKDLRTVLGEPVQGTLGADVLRRRQPRPPAATPCSPRSRRPLAKPAAQVYPGDDACTAGDQWCADTIIHRALGGITHHRIQLAEPSDLPAGGEVPVAPAVVGRFHGARTRVPHGGQPSSRSRVSGRARTQSRETTAIALTYQPTEDEPNSPWSRVATSGATAPPSTPPRLYANDAPE